MLAHFQEEEAAGRAHGVLGDETTIITLNTLTSVTLRTRSFFPLLSFTHCCEACLLGLRCILSFFCNFCLIPIRSFLVFGLYFFGIPLSLCNLLYPPFLPSFCFLARLLAFRVLYPVVSFFSFPATPHFYISLQVLIAITHLRFFLLLYCLCSMFLVCLFCFALANMGRVYSLILQHGKWERTGSFRGFQSGKWSFRLLENFTGLRFFQSVCFMAF